MFLASSLFVVSSIPSLGSSKPHLTDLVEYGEKTYEDVTELQRNAILANEILIQSFEHSDTILYPEDYAGVFIDYDKLHLVLTPGADVQHYCDVLGEYCDYVIFDFADYSFNDLLSLSEEYISRIPENALSSVGIMSDIDAVHIEVYSEYEDEVIKCINGDFSVDDNYDFFGSVRRAILADHLLITFTDSKISSTTSFIPSGNSVQSRNNVSSVFGTSTLGGSGTYTHSGTTNDSFLVAGHAINSTYNLLFYSNNYIGTMQYCRFTNNGYGDFAFTTMSSAYSPNYYTHVSYYGTTTLTGYVLSPPQYASVSTYGQTSGAASGMVIETGITAIYQYYIGYSNNEPQYAEITIKGLSKIKLSSGSCASGDSGGTVRSGYSFAGIVDASNIEVGNYYVYFTPYYYINQAGFTVCTN